MPIHKTDWVPHPIHGAMWSNYQFIDLENGDENFTHMVSVAPLDMFRVDLGDQVHQSALGILPVPPPQFMYQTDLKKFGYDVASQFALALQKVKSLTVAASTGVADPMNSVSTGSQDRTQSLRTFHGVPPKLLRSARSSPL